MEDDFKFLENGRQPNRVTKNNQKKKNNEDDFFFFIFLLQNGRNFNLFLMEENLI
jgi:hypothetical protein